MRNLTYWYLCMRARLTGRVVKHLHVKEALLASWARGEGYMLPGKLQIPPAPPLPSPLTKRREMKETFYILATL